MTSLAFCAPFLHRNVFESLSSIFPAPLHSAYSSPSIFRTRILRHPRLTYCRIFRIVILYIQKQGYPYLSGLHSVSSHQKLASFWMSLSPPASSGSKQDADLFREFCCCCARLDASKVDKLDSMSLLIRAALSKSDTLRSDGVSRSLHLSSLLQSPVHRLMI